MENATFYKYKDLPENIGLYLIQLNNYLLSESCTCCFKKCEQSTKFTVGLQHGENGILFLYDRAFELFICSNCYDELTQDEHNQRVGIFLKSLSDIYLKDLTHIKNIEISIITHGHNIDEIEKDIELLKSKKLS